MTGCDGYGGCSLKNIDLTDRRRSNLDLVVLFGQNVPRRDYIFTVVPHDTAMSGRCVASFRSPGVASTSAKCRRTTRTACLAMRAGPSTPPPTYSDTWLDRFWLQQFHRQVAIELGDDPNTATGDYDATMKRCIKLVSTSRTPQEAQQRGERVLRSLLPPGFEVGFKVFIALLPEWFVARHAAKVTPYLLPWLVGASAVIDAPVNLPVDDQSRIPSNALYNALKALKLEIAARRILELDPSTYGGDVLDADSLRIGDAKTACSFPGSAPPGYQQGVLLERCRVLEESGCASVCLNVCKLPTQQFFNERVGLAVTLVPDYETFECRFVYGKTPPPTELDDAFNTPCFSQCPITRDQGKKEFLANQGKNGASERVGASDSSAASSVTTLCDRLPLFVGEGSGTSETSETDAETPVV